MLSFKQFQLDEMIDMSVYTYKNKSHPEHASERLKHYHGDDTHTHQTKINTGEKIVHQNHTSEQSAHDHLINKGFHLSGVQHNDFNEEVGPNNMSFETLDEMDRKLKNQYNQQLKRANKSGQGLDMKLIKDMPKNRQQKLHIEPDHDLVNHLKTLPVKNIKTGKNEAISPTLVTIYKIINEKYI